MDPIPKEKGVNIALVLRSDINNTVNLSSNQSSTEFWTDSNGIKMLRRITNYRETFNFDSTQSIASNFYPVVESISIREKASQDFSANKYEGLSLKDRMISIFNDRPQSGGVLEQGEIILLINRVSLKDDAKGMGESLFESDSMMKSFKVQHIIMFGLSIFSSNESEVKSHQFMYNFFHNTPVLFNSFQSRHFQSYSVLSQFISISENIVIDYYFLIKDTIEIQFYCKYDYYYQTSVKGDDLSSYFGMISVNPDGYNVEVTDEYFGRSDYFKAYHIIRMKTSKRFFLKLGANDIYILRIHFLA